MLGSCIRKNIYGGQTVKGNILTHLQVCPHIRVQEGLDKRCENDCPEKKDENATRSHRLGLEDLIVRVHFLC